MELMSTSLDKFYRYVYCALDDVIPEEILGKITLAVSENFFIHTYKLIQGYGLRCIWNSLSFVFCLQTVKALNHLKENLKIIHRGELDEVLTFIIRFV